MTEQAIKDNSRENADAKPVCGLIMPISAMPPLYDAAHWADVRAVFDEAISEAGLRPQMVSDSFESDVIQQRIIANIFNNPVAVCDVSGLNANVMFELGLRLASKKATIIVTDSFDTLPFDTRIIEHVAYPRSLRLRETREFISELTTRVADAYSRVNSAQYKPFLENFTGVEAEEPHVPDASDLQYIRLQLENMQRQIAQIPRSYPIISSTASPTMTILGNPKNIIGAGTMTGVSPVIQRYDIPRRVAALQVSDKIGALDGVFSVSVEANADKTTSITVQMDPAKATDVALAIRNILHPTRTE